MMYKIANGLVGIPAKTYLIPVNTVTRKQHSLSYLIPHTRCYYHLYSFLPCTIRLWNSLPQHVVNQNSLDAFKSNIQISMLRLGGTEKKAVITYRSLSVWKQANSVEDFQNSLSFL